MTPLRKLQLWSAIAALVIVQAPGVFAKGEPPRKKAHVDLEIQQLESSGVETVKVILRTDRKIDWAKLRKALRNHDVIVTRIAPRTNAIAATISTSDLVWLETLPGIASISIDAPDLCAPVRSRTPHEHRHGPG